MHYQLLSLATVLTLSLSCFGSDQKGKDLGFRFKSDAGGACVNEQGRTGYNPHFVGPCGDLRGLSLRGRQLSGMDLRGAMMDGMNLRGLQLDGANLTGAKARGTNFSKSKLNGANLTEADLSGSNFYRAELNGADFSGAILSGSEIGRAQVEGAQFTRADLGGAKLNTSLSSAQVNGAMYSVGTEIPLSAADLQKRGMIEASKSASVPTERRPANR